MEHGPERFLKFPDGMQGAGWIVQGEHFLESEGGPAAECVAATQQEHAVRPGLVDGPAPRQPLTCGERFCRVSVMAWLASAIRRK